MDSILKVNYPMIAANVYSSQLKNVEASTVVNVKGRKVSERVFLIWLKYLFSLILKLQSKSKVGIIGYVTEQTPQKSQPGPETTFLPIIQSIRWNYKDLLLFCQYPNITGAGTKHKDWRGKGWKYWSRWAMQVMVLVLVIVMVNGHS